MVKPPKKEDKIILPSIKEEMPAPEKPEREIIPATLGTPPISKPANNKEQIKEEKIPVTPGKMKIPEKQEIPKDKDDEIPTNKKEKIEVEIEDSKQSIKKGKGKFTSRISPARPPEKE